MTAVEAPSEGTGARIAQVSARDGTTLVTRHWPVGTGTPWGTVLIVHGLAEHSGRYEHVGALLAAAGLETLAFDLRGFGASGGPRASVERWSQLHDDVEERLIAARSIAPGRPLVLYGHSLGGLISLGYVLDGRSRPDLLVLSAPAIGARIPLWQRAVVGSLRRVAPGVALDNGLDPNALCCNPVVGRDYKVDPLNQHRSTVGFAAAALAEQRRVAAALDRLAIPTIVIHGGADTIVPTEVSQALEGRPGVVRHVYPGLRHELHNESEGPVIVATVIDWIREQASRRHVPAAANGSP